MVRMLKTKHGWRENPTVLTENPTLLAENPTVLAETPTVLAENPTVLAENRNLCQSIHCMSAKGVTSCCIPRSFSYCSHIS